MRNAELILEREQKANSTYTYDVSLVRYGVLMHDVGDKKYALPGTCHSSSMIDSPISLLLTCV